MFGLVMMSDICEGWNECRTLSRDNLFYWRGSDDDVLLIKRVLEEGIDGRFSREEYESMINLVVESWPNGTPLGARGDGNVANNSVGALLTRMRDGENGVRPLCAHLVAVAESNGLLTYEDRGRGPGRGLWLFPVDSE